MSSPDPLPSNVSGRRGAGVIGLLWRLLLLIALAETSLFALMSPLARVPAAAMRLSLAAITLFIAFLLLPSLHRERDGLRAGVLAAWSAASSAAVLLLLAINGRNTLEPAATLPAAIAVFAAMLALCGAVAALASLGMGPERAHRVVLIAGLLSGAAPLWLGPLAATWAVAPEFTVKLSLLSYLAGMVEYDVLRDQWFYQRTPLGGMRYTYPPALFTTLLLAAAGIGGLLAAALRDRMRRGEGVRPFRFLFPLHEESAR